MPIRRSSAPDARLAGLAAREPIRAGREFAVTVDVEPWLFAGGAQPRTSDPVCVLRPPSLLGQYRYFWRLLADAPDLGGLRQREAQVFGAQAPNPAPFRIEVAVERRGDMVAVPARINDPGSYVTFAGREERQHGQVKQKAADMRGGVRAVITLREELSSIACSQRGSASTGPDPWPELLRAVRAWLLLGGVGGRTRRGLGAVQADPSPGSLAALDALLLSVVGTPGGAKCDGHVRSIAEVWRTKRTFPKALDALVALEDWLKQYRQDRRPGQQRNRPGRSYWDEPELIRRLTRARDPRHQPLPVPQGRHAEGWARGVLGLPIVFHFGDRQDPGDTTLQGARRGIERMASPLLFRPVRVKAGEYVGLVTRLSEPYLPPGGIGLKTGHGVSPVESTHQLDRVWSDLFRAGEKYLNLRRIV